MGNKLELGGISAFTAELAKLAPSMRDASDPILLAHATAAADELRARYPLGPTGNLRKGVGVQKQSARGVAALYKLRSMSPTAHLYEFGTMRGGTQRQPPRATFLPIAAKKRRAMVAAVVPVVEATGLSVTGDAE